MIYIVDRQIRFVMSAVSEYSHNREHLLPASSTATTKLASMSDEDVNMADGELPRFSTEQKGKGKAPETTTNEPQLDNNLPWYVTGYTSALFGLNACTGLRNTDQ